MKKIKYLYISYHILQYFISFC